jgi:hypothetical protein
VVVNEPMPGGSLIARITHCGRGSTTLKTFRSAQCPSARRTCAAGGDLKRSGAAIRNWTLPPHQTTEADQVIVKG